MKSTLRAIASVSAKEFLHIYRDRRILVLLLTLPPLLTLMFGHAFESSGIRDTPALLQDRDETALSRKFVETLRSEEACEWKVITANDVALQPEHLLAEGVQAMLVIPKGWSDGIASGRPLPLALTVDGTDSTTAPRINGAVQETLGNFQLQAREEFLANLPEPVLETAAQLPPEIKAQFESLMTPWLAETKVLYNPKLRFIDFVMPGIIGLILQLLTVTLTACTIARERESGTLSQLMVTSLQQTEIVIGKVLPYLGVSIVLVLMSVAVGHFHFHVEFRQPLVLALICSLFLLCSLGLGLLISAFCPTQTQAIQIAIFYLLPVFPLSGAFAPLADLPANIRWLSYTFPLTHFCQAFRLISLQQADFSYIWPNVAFLLAGTLVTCGGAALMLRRAQG